MPRRLPAITTLCALLATAVGGTEPAHVDGVEDASSALQTLERTTASLERFRDIEAARTAGYVHYDGYDTFAMGEHWYNHDVYETDTCDVSKPSHLQYLLIEGRRTLIGAGYVCRSDSRAELVEPLFGEEVVWHSHGPAWCGLPNGSFEDYRNLADVLPNQLTDATWQQVCRQHGGQPGH